MMAFLFEYVVIMCLIVPSFEKQKRPIRILILSLFSRYLNVFLIFYNDLIEFDKYKVDNWFSE